MKRVPLVTLYRLDYREPIQWPLEKRREKSEEQKWRARLLILYGLDYREPI